MPPLPHPSLIDPWICGIVFPYCRVSLHKPREFPAAGKRGLRGRGIISTLQRKPTNHLDAAMRQCNDAA
jgi:hypothetical protein